MSARPSISRPASAKPWRPWWPRACACASRPGTARIYAALDQGQADLAVTASKPEGKGLGIAELDRERLTLVAAPELAARVKGRAVAAGLLQDLLCLAYDAELALIDAFFAAVFGAPAALRPVATAPDLRILLGMAAAGMGWTVLPDYLCAEALAAGRLAELPTESAGPTNTLFLAWTRASLRDTRTVHVRDVLLRRFRTA